MPTKNAHKVGGFGQDILWSIVLFPDEIENKWCF